MFQMKMKTMKKGMKGKGVSQRRLVLKSKETPATVYLIQSGRRHAEAASTHYVNCKLLSGKEEDLEFSDVFVSAVSFCPMTRRLSAESTQPVVK